MSSRPRPRLHRSGGPATPTVTPSPASRRRHTGTHCQCPGLRALVPVPFGTASSARAASPRQCPARFQVLGSHAGEPECAFPLHPALPILLPGCRSGGGRGLSALPALPNRLASLRIRCAGLIPADTSPPDHRSSPSFCLQLARPTRRQPWHRVMRVAGPRVAGAGWFKSGHSQAEKKTCQQLEEATSSKKRQS
jgi:hypothetical protein